MRIKVIDRRVSEGMYVYELLVTEPRELSHISVLYGIDANQWIIGAETDFPVSFNEALEIIKRRIAEELGVPVEEIEIEVEEIPFQI